mmetsp:Transcript_609/g.959  ORF Transcript_609/g.959 Transcript_609/m.959 type:complete len:446 (+) Transcript_609:119-1456(+)
MSSSSNKASRTLKYADGATQFRLRLVTSLLSSRPLLLRNIRSDDLDAPGLREHEASFLRLLDRMTNGTRIEINATGTQLRFKPGVLLGGDIEHDCPVGSNGGRSVGWFLEGVFPLAAFGKEPLRLTLTGITDGTSDVDPSPDYLSSSFVPLMIKLGIGDDGDHPPPSLTVRKRGAAPAGGGVVEFSCPIVKELRPLDHVDFGKVKRIRGTAVSCRIPPSSAARVAHSAKGVMHRLLPDVWIHTDVHSGSGRKRKGGGVGVGDDSAGGCGPSPGLGVMLTATTTEGVCLSSECSMNHNVKGSNNEGGDSFYDADDREEEPLQRKQMELPEDLGRRSAALLLHEIHAGGCVDAGCQSFALLMMCLTPEDVSRIRLGPLSPYAVVGLRLYKEAFGVEFKLRVVQEGRSGSEEDGEDAFGDDGRRSRGQKTVVCSCLGIGYRNMARAST